MRHLTIFLFLCSFELSASVYQCESGVFQSDPCDDNIEPMTLESGSVVEYRAIKAIPKNNPQLKTEQQQVATAPKHYCKGRKIPKDAMRFRQLAMCMTESQMLKIAGPQQYSVKEYFRDGKHYKQYRFMEPRAGFSSSPLVEGGYVIEVGGSTTYTNTTHK